MMFMKSAELSTYDKLKATWGEETARLLFDLVESTAEAKVKAQSDTLSTKKELSGVELLVVKSKGELEVKISDSKSEIIRWMFGFWIAQAITTFGFILLFIKK